MTVTMPGRIGCPQARDPAAEGGAAVGAVMRCVVLDTDTASFIVKKHLPITLATKLLNAQPSITARSGIGGSCL
jgi:hypothetical protein